MMQKMCVQNLNVINITTMIKGKTLACQSKTAKAVQITEEKKY